MPTTPESTALAKALKRYGFRFVGPTTAYAAMQSLGLVNDHLAGCHVRAACEADRRGRRSPALTQGEPGWRGTSASWRDWAMSRPRSSQTTPSSSR